MMLKDVDMFCQPPTKIKRKVLEVRRLPVGKAQEQGGTFAMLMCLAALGYAWALGNWGQMVLSSTYL